MLVEADPAVGNVGIPELIVIFILALLVFGPKKLPELGRTLGKALAEFRRASAELRGAMEHEMHELERHAQELETKAQETVEPAPQLPPAPSGGPEPPVGSGSIDPAAGSPQTAPPADAAASNQPPADGEIKPA